MDRINTMLDSRTIRLNGGTFPMPSRSHGLATYPADGRQPTELFDVADARLYQNKGRKLNSDELAASEIPPEEDGVTDS